MYVKQLTSAACLAAILLTAGCAEPGPDGRQDWQLKEQNAQQDQVKQVVCFFTQSMWQSFDAEGDRNPEGFKFTLYLLSARTGLGVLVDGLIRVKMYSVDRDEDNRIVRKLVQEWNMKTSDLPRAREQRAFGYAYVPYLYWGDIDVLGRQVEISVEYESPSGRVVRSQTTTHKVPAPRT
jgi:hypothetical protein